MAWCDDSIGSRSARRACVGLIALVVATAATIIGATPSVAAAAGDSSSIVVRARGALGTENMELWLNGEAIGSWEGIGTSLIDLVVEVEEAATVDELRVVFTNDGGWPEADRNLFVDWVSVDGVVFESEAGSTLSGGSWQSGSGCAEGFKRSEWLHCGRAFFDYDDARGIELAAPLQENEDDDLPLSPQQQILVMTKTSVFAHDSIEDGKRMLDGLAATHDFELTYTEDSSIFTDAGAVEEFDAVFFLNTDSVVFDNDREKRAFQSFIEGGAGFIGVHGAAATHWRIDKWDWYRDLVGRNRPGCRPWTSLNESLAHNMAGQGRVVQL